MRGPLCDLRCSWRWLRSKIIFYHREIFLDAGASGCGGESRFWQELGMRMGITVFQTNHVLNVPFVLGTSPSRPATLLVAVLKATARALKADSAL